jgi:hypothetical protein
MLSYSQLKNIISESTSEDSITKSKIPGVGKPLEDFLHHLAGPCDPSNYSSKILEEYININDCEDFFLKE